MGTHRYLHHLLAIALSGLLLGCGSTQSTTIPQSYASEVTLRLERARQEDFHRIRYNPCACDCPPFELAVNTEKGLRWHRIELVGEDDADGLDGALADRLSQRREFNVRGTLEPSLERCGKGTFVFSLSLTELLST